MLFKMMQVGGVVVANIDRGICGGCITAREAEESHVR